jgi:hypothetical protein
LDVCQCVVDDKKQVKAGPYVSSHGGRKTDDTLSVVKSGRTKQLKQDHAKTGSKQSDTSAATTKKQTNITSVKGNNKSQEVKPQNASPIPPIDDKPPSLVEDIPTATYIPQSSHPYYTHQSPVNNPFENIVTDSFADAPECEWPILNPTSCSFIKPSDVSRPLHIDGPPVNIMETTVVTTPYVYANSNPFLLSEYEPPFHLLQANTLGKFLCLSYYLWFFEYVVIYCQLYRIATNFCSPKSNLSRMMNI